MQVVRKTFSLISILLLIIGIFPAGAQEMHTKSGKAIRYFNDAREMYFLMKYNLAAETIEKAVAADPDFLEAQLLRAEIYSDMKKRTKSIEAYKEVLRIDSTYFPNAMYNLGRLEFRLGKYEEALHHLESFLRYKNIIPLGFIQVALLKRLRDQKRQPPISEDLSSDSNDSGRTYSRSELLRGALLTINGIAAGMRNTG